MIYILYEVLYLIFASIVFYLLYNKFTWKVNNRAIFIGFLFMLLAVIIQSIIQDIPADIIAISFILKGGLIHNLANLNNIILNIIRPYYIIYGIYLGIIAGLAQEIARYYSVKNKDPRLSIYYGYGFALVDIIVAILSLFTNNSTIIIITIVGVLLQPFISYIYHPGASMLLRAKQENNKGIIYLLYLIFVHAYVDGFTAVIDLSIKFNSLNEYILLNLSYIYFITIIIIPLVIFYLGYRNIRRLIVEVDL
ncbi:hypothetical protein [Nanobdella aerobiophila]|nr:hypothetical protein [Nanobdella aerobiophila]